MSLSAKDVVDLVAKCDERLRQNWIGFVTLSYGIAVLLAERKDHCLIRSTERGDLDAKEWLVIVYPIFAAFFVCILCRAFLERRIWIRRALLSHDICNDVGPEVRARWVRWDNCDRRIRADLSFALGIALVFISAEIGIMEICGGVRKPWFGHATATIAQAANPEGAHWWVVTLLAAAAVLVVWGFLILVSYVGRREGDVPQVAQASFFQRLAIESRHGWQISCRVFGFGLGRRSDHGSSQITPPLPGEVAGGDS